MTKDIQLFDYQEGMVKRVQEAFRHNDSVMVQMGSPDNVRGKHYPNISTKHDRLPEKMFTFAV